MKTTIYLIRHAEAEGNIKRTFQGHTDAALTPKGEHQLERLAERFRTIPIDAVYASPLLRTRKTAEAANRYHGLEITIVPELIEINGGDWEGVPWDEMYTRYPEEQLLWDTAPHLCCPPNGESMRAVYERMSAAVDAIARENAGKTAVVVSHGGAIRNYLCHAYGWPHERLCDVGWEENTAVSLVEYNEAFCPNVVYHNDASHLTAEQCTVLHQDWSKTPVEK